MGCIARLAVRLQCAVGHAALGARILLVAAASLAAAATCVHQAGAQQPDTPAGVRRLADAGARRLALERIATAQPMQVDAPHWLEWERLRLDLLAAGGQERELLARVSQYPPEVDRLPGSGVVPLYQHAARSALRMGDGAQSRRWLIRLFAHPGIDALLADGVAYRAARHAVIEAYLAEGSGDAAYRTMLRYQQEFSPLRAEEAERFVAGLIALDRLGDAANWLAQIDSRSSYAAILRFRAGLITADAALAQARAGIARGGDPGALALLEAVGRAQANRSHLVEAAELRFALPAAGGSTSPGADAHRASALKGLYGESAQQIANQAQLLVGDDAAWLAHANRMLSLHPPLGRALLGHLAFKSARPAIRSDAALLLVASLKEAKLGAVALGLFGEGGAAEVDALDSRLRHELGGMAADARRPEQALRYWRGLTPPSGLTQEQWQLRRLGVTIDAGNAEDAQALARELLTPVHALSTESRKRLIDVALEALGRAQAAVAESILVGLRSRIQDAERFVVLGALGRAYEARGNSVGAAAAYLEASVSVPAADADRDALRLRESAAVNLLRAGFKEDARGVYDWLARHARDAVVRESAVRALKAL